MKKLNSKLFNGNFQLNKKNLVSIYGGYYSTYGANINQTCPSDYDTKDGDTTKTDWGCIVEPKDKVSVLSPISGSK
jgi:hypothetical protein